MNKIRLIQCGVGGWGKGWLVDHAHPSPDFEVVAIADVSPDALQDAGRKCSIPAGRQFASLQAALDQVEADAVLTVTPPPVHVEHARLAFARGLHVMTEKPIAATVEHAQEMIALAKKSGRQLVVSQQYRYTPQVRKLRQLFAEKAMGEFGHGHLDFYIPADFTGTFREKMEFPLLLDMAIHHVDLIRAITGRDIVAITARSFRPSWSWYAHEPGLKMLLDLEGGLPFSYSGDWSARGRGTGWSGDWHLQGSTGALHLQKDKIFLARSERWGKDETFEEIPPSPEERPAQSETLRRFAEAIRTGVPAETSGLDNVRSLAVVIGAIRSVKEKRTVTLEEILSAS